MEEELTVEQLIGRIKDHDDKVRAAAWHSAGKLGAAAVMPLANLMAQMDAQLARLTKQPGADRGELAYKLEVGRAAKRGLWVVVRYVGRPGAGAERGPVVDRLCTLLGDDQPVALRRDVLWMLSEIGDDRAVDAIRNIPGILGDLELREDARCAVERIPGQAATQALSDGLEACYDDFRLAIAHSLRLRGVELDKEKYPCQKLVPTRQTKVKPVAQ
jgi:HEAT repeat protein